MKSFWKGKNTIKKQNDMFDTYYFRYTFLY